MIAKNKENEMFDENDIDHWMKDSDGISYFKKENFNKNVEFKEDLDRLKMEFPNLNWIAAKEREHLIFGRAIDIFAVTSNLSKTKQHSIIKINKNNFNYIVHFEGGNSGKLKSIEDVIEKIKLLISNAIKFYEEKIENIKKEFGI